MPIELSDEKGYSFLSFSSIITYFFIFWSIKINLADDNRCFDKTWRSLQGMWNG